MRCNTSQKKFNSLPEDTENLGMDYVNPSLPVMQKEI